jgi:RNA polymerase sigma factor (sigma-70 family)
VAEELIGGSQLYDEDYRKAQERLRKQSEEAVREADDARIGDVSVLIVDDQDLVRSGFRLILSSYDHIDVVGEAGNGAAAYDRALELHPDVVLMDIRMPVEDGISATRRIAEDERLAGTHVLVLTTFDVDEYVYDALSAGASGFMLKDAEPDDIVRAVRTVAKGDALIQPSVTRRLIETFVDSRVRAVRAEHELSDLTDRESEILKLVAHGMTNEQIAEQLVISPATVKTHLARVMNKLDAHDRAQLVVIAYETGLVTPGQQ